MVTPFKQGRALMAIALPRHNTEQLWDTFSPITSVCYVIKEIIYGSVMAY